MNPGAPLHLRVSQDGVILTYQLAAANASDLEVLPEVGLPAGTTGIGDRTYWSPTVTAKLAAAGVRLQTRYRTKQHDSDPAPSRRLTRSLESRYGSILLPFVPFVFFVVLYTLPCPDALRSRIRSSQPYRLVRDQDIFKGRH